MKLRLMFGGMGLMAASLGFAQLAAPPALAPASTPTPAPAPGAEATKAAPPPASSAKTTPKTGTTATKKDATKKEAPKSTAAKKAPPPVVKKEEPPPTVEGLAISRTKGGFLGLQVINSNFVLTFYDEKKKKMAPDVTRAALRWPVGYQPGPERTVLNPGGGFSLTSAKVVKPPRVFKLFISLLVEGSEEPVESYTIDYHGE